MKPFRVVYRDMEISESQRTNSRANACKKLLSWWLGPSSKWTIVHKKLIEVALPLEAITRLRAGEIIRHGHPAPASLVASAFGCGAGRDFSPQMVTIRDTSGISLQRRQQEKERQRLFRI